MPGMHQGAPQAVTTAPMSMRPALSPAMLPGAKVEKPLLGVHEALTDSTSTPASVLTCATALEEPPVLARE